MAITKDRALSRQLSALFNIGAIRELTDGQLLERFARGDGEPAELAFAALVERHGAMVLRVCRAQLNNPHDTQDAFQATFLVLVEKARGLWVRDSLGPWLHQVALRTASCARASAIRRKRLEGRAAGIAASRDSHEDPVTPELARVLHEEIDRLPERYRVPIVLCDLEGRTCEEAARVMGRPVGTIKCWRARGRDRLRDRLIRSGLVPSVAAGAVMAADVARAAVPGPAVRAAVRILSDRMTAGVVPASVSMLVKGVIKAMFMRKLRTTAAGLCILTCLGVGLAATGQVAGDDPKRPAEPSPAAGSHRASGQRPAPTIAKSASLGQESWPMSLREAIRIGLDNSEIIRVISLGTDGQPVGGFEPAAPDPVGADGGPRPIVIARLNHDAPPYRVQAELMAHVRSVEQQYWNLGVSYVQLWATERAVRLTQEVLDREQARSKAGRSNTADVAEAAQRLEQFHLDLATRTSDVITTERQLRFLLGLPPTDNRRIVPVTAPTEARLEPDWDKCLAAMLEKQPDILLARAMVKEAEGRRSAANLDGVAADLDRVAGAFLPALASAGKRTPSADAARSRADQLERQKAFLQQVVHQTTHSLARFFLEIDSNYKQFRKATEVRADLARRLDALRADQEAGRIRIDRYFDAISQYTAAVTAEAQYKATYNISHAAMEETKGTLLEFDKIVLDEGPKGIQPPIGRSDGEVKHASLLPIGPAPAPVATPPGVGQAAGPPPAKEESTKADATGKTVSFHLTIGAGPRPIEIRGSFTVAPARAQDHAATKSP